MDILLAVLITATSWLSARLGVVMAIHAAQDADHMIRYMLGETFWLTMFVVILSMFTSWGTSTIIFLIPRMLFLIFTDWHSLHAHFDELKSLIK